MRALALERIALALERLAAALEAPRANTVTQVGYGCANCQQWILPGLAHTCAKPPSFLGGGTSARCAYTTAAHMRCTLDANHASGHNIGV